MSRLTEQEINLIHQARRTAGSESVDLETAVQQGRRLRAKAMARMIAHTVDVAARVTGLKLLSETVFRPIRCALKRQATLEQLRRLDNRMLEDIGLDRGMINGYAQDLSASEPPRARPTLIERFRRWRHQRATIRQLEALDDHMLDDIGLVRGAIARIVKEAILAEDSPEAQRTRVQDLIDQIDRSAAGIYHRNVTRQVSRRIVRLEGAEMPKIGFVGVRA